jgi:hypothetical protein
VAADVAYVTLDSLPLLLAGPVAGDVSERLRQPCIQVAPGSALDLDEYDLEQLDLDALCEALRARGLAGVEVVEWPWGERTLTVRTPDDHRIVFHERRELTREEALDLYVRGPDELEAALADLSEADLDLARSGDQWSIRKIVHHVADGDGLFLQSIRAALADSGRTFTINMYDQTRWAETLDYGHRAIAPSLAFVRALRGNVLQMLEHAPGGWERYVLMSDHGVEGEPFKEVVGMRVTILARHIFEHAEEIREIRRLHGR